MKNKEMAYYLAGLERAARVVHEQGIEDLDKEVQFRKATGINSRLTFRELDCGLEAIKELTIDTVLTLAMVTLRDEFGFGHDRLIRFRDRFMLKTECLNQSLTTWQDQCDIIEQETGIRVRLIDSLERKTGMIRE